MPSHQPPRLKRSARDELAAAKRLKKKKKARKLARQNAQAEAEAEAEDEVLANRLESAAPARDDLDYETWHSGSEADSDSALLSVGDDAKHLNVGDDAKHPNVGGDVNHLSVGGDYNHPQTISSDSEDDVQYVGHKAEADGSSTDGPPITDAVRDPHAPSSPVSQLPKIQETSSVLLLNKGSRAPQLSPQQQLLLLQQQLQPQPSQLQAHLPAATGADAHHEPLRGTASPPKQTKPPLLTLQQQLEVLHQKQQAWQQQQQQQQQPKSAETNTIEEARAQIKQLEARLAVESHVLKGHLQREALEAAEKEERKFEQRLSPSLKLLTVPDYASRFEILVKGGWSMPEVHKALQITALGDNFSVERALAHFLAIQAKEIREVLEKAEDGCAEAGQALLRIVDTSACARVLAEIPDAVDIVVKLKSYHARAKVRATHNALPALCAANLVQVATVQNDQSTKRFGYSYLCRVAAAVSEDCTECQALREKRTQQEAWKAAAAQAATAKQDKATAAKRAREQAATSTKEVGFIPDLPFKLSDSRRATNKKHGECEDCGLGFTGPRNTRWLFFCQHCDKGYHMHCTTWSLFRLRDGTELIGCRPCMDTNELAYANGETTDEWKILQTNVKGKAPNHCDASELPPNAVELSSLSQVEQAGTTPPRTPTKQLERASSGSSCNSGSSAAVASHYSQRALGNGPSFLDPEFGSNVSTSNIGLKLPPNVKQKDYTKWEAIPHEWAPKKDAKSNEHPEKGYGQEAYKRWRRINVDIRDSASENTSYGLLARALSDEIKVSLGTQFLASENHMPSIWDRPTNLTQKQKDKWIDHWVDTHKDYAWVHFVDDETLLRVMDKHFGVKSTSVFLSKRFPSNLPLTNEKGEVNYYETEFNRWATTWQAELITLQKSSCDFSGTDLHQALLNGLSTNKTIWNEASQNSSRSPTVLIAYLRDWLRKKSLVAQELRDEREALLAQQKPPEGAKPSPNPSKVTPTNAGQDDSTARAMALFTQTMTAVANQMAGGAASQNDGEKPTKPLPPHLKGCKDPAKCKCAGCGNVWARNRPIPCFYACKFMEHPAYNQKCNTESYSNKDPLTWKDFAQKHPNTTLPPNCVAWEKNNEAYHAKKRTGRDETTTSTKR